MVWSDDGWLRTADGEGVPRLEVPSAGLPRHEFPTAPERTRFDRPELPPDFQWLRSPWPDELFSLTACPGRLRLYGLESPGSFFRQSLVARRQQAHCFGAGTRMLFEPEHFQQMAGLICYYNAAKFHYLYVSRDESNGRFVRAMSCIPDLARAEDVTAPIPIPSVIPVELRVEVDCERLHFGYRAGDDNWCWMPQLDASILSDEAGPPFHPNFTGAFVGVCCQDLAGTRHPADFEYFDYREREYSHVLPPPDHS
jgi:xylan 1,4-beta-xylosidase